MSETDGKKPLGLGGGGSRPGQVKQSFSHGRTHNVVVETKRKRVVVPKPGASIDADEIISFARSRIAAFKAPKSVDVIAALPRNASGKILRRELRAPYWAGRNRQVN